MKYYGFKTSIFGQACQLENIDRRRQYYKALLRAGRKHARQEGKRQAREVDHE